MSKPLVTFSHLGRIGQFGNQLFQYTFLRLLAERWGADYAVPAWKGQELFGLVDPPIPPPDHRQMGFYPDEGHDIPTGSVWNFEQAPCQYLDIAGWFQYHTSFYRPHRDRIRQWFTFKEPPRLGYEHMDIIALHLRRGDYVTSTKGFAFVPPDEWYMEWIERIWGTFKNPVLYIASDDASCVQRFKPFPQIGTDMAMDFYALTQAKALAISNSTFSFAAAMLNTQAREFVRPVIDRYPMTGGLKRFDPWDSEPLLHRDRPECGQN